MTEVPEHLLKRAQAAREKAAASEAPAEAPAAGSDAPADPRIPAHLLERSKARKAQAFLVAEMESLRREAASQVAMPSRSIFILSLYKAVAPAVAAYSALCCGDLVWVMSRMVLKRASLNAAKSLSSYRPCSSKRSLIS